VFSALDDDLEQVGKHQDVDGEEGEADGCGAANDFEDFPGQEGCGDGNRHVFGPGLFKIEADALGHAQGGVGEEGNAEATEDFVVYEGRFVENEIDEVGLGAEVKVVGKMSEGLGKIVVHQAQGTDGDSDEQGCLGELEGGDEH